jgi:hypothetical protein
MWRWKPDITLAGMAEFWLPTPTDNATSEEDSTSDTTDEGET